MGYGTGAIMAVPSGDQRDFEFARRYDLPIVATQLPPASWFDHHGIASSTDCATWPEAYIGEGVYVNSANDGVVLDGDRPLAEGQAADQRLAGQGGFRRGDGHLQAALAVLQQRYWGEPFPIVYDASDRPLALPESCCLSRCPTSTTSSPAPSIPTTTTEPVPHPSPGQRTGWRSPSTWATGPAATGGAERHAPVGRLLLVRAALPGPHQRGPSRRPRGRALLDGPPPGRDRRGRPLRRRRRARRAAPPLSRFWHKVLFDLGVVSSEEPFHRLFNQGYIQAYAYRDRRPDRGGRGRDRSDGGWWLGGEPVAREYGKMGKSLRNVVTPDEMYDAYRADTFRLYEMAMGPLDVSRPWNTATSSACSASSSAWRVLVDEETGELRDVDREPSDEDLRVLHRTIDGVRADMEGLRFNAAIAKLIELTNPRRVGGAPAQSSSRSC